MAPFFPAKRARNFSLLANKKKADRKHANYVYTASYGNSQVTTQQQLQKRDSNKSSSSSNIIRGFRDSQSALSTMKVTYLNRIINNCIKSQFR